MLAGSPGKRGGAACSDFARHRLANLQPAYAEVCQRSASIGRRLGPLLRKRKDFPADHSYKEQLCRCSLYLRVHTEAADLGSNPERLTGDL